MQSNKDNLEKIYKWIETQIDKNPYSEITIKVSLHDGKIKKIERGLTEKIL